MKDELTKEQIEKIYAHKESVIIGPLPRFMHFIHSRPQEQRDKIYKKYRYGKGKNQKYIINFEKQRIYTLEELGIE